MKRRVESKIEHRVVGFEELLVAVRYVESGKLKYDYLLSQPVATPPLARVAKAEHRIEECLKRSKSEAGLGD